MPGQGGATGSTITEYKAYDKPDQKIVGERHRHRYEFNDDYVKQFEAAGLIIAGRSVIENLAEIVEAPR